MNETPTPRTDAIADHARNMLLDYDCQGDSDNIPTPIVVPADFARTLERELAESLEAEASETRWAAQYKRERDEARDQIEEMEIRHAAAMLHTQTIVDDANNAREQRNRLATELRGISEVTADAWDLKFSEFVSEFLPWAQNRCRAALAAVKGGSNE